MPRNNDARFQTQLAIIRERKRERDLDIFLRFRAERKKMSILKELNVQSKIPALLSCRADHSLHFNTNLRPRAYKMVTKFVQCENVNIKSLL